MSNRLHLRRSYICLLLASLLAIVSILLYGLQLYPSSLGQSLAPVASSHTVPRLLMALTVIIALAKILGRLFSYLGQPPVMGEVMSGIALGPSLLGRFFPENPLFPAEILPILNSFLRSESSSFSLQSAWNLTRAS